MDDGQIASECLTNIQQIEPDMENLKVNIPQVALLSREGFIIGNVAHLSYA